MPSQLSIYNGALSILGERKLASLTENREPRYKLDDVWGNDLIRRVLQMGQWNFAKRTIELDASPSVTPSSVTSTDLKSRRILCEQWPLLTTST